MSVYYKLKRSTYPEGRCSSWSFHTHRQTWRRPRPSRCRATHTDMVAVSIKASFEPGGNKKFAKKNSHTAKINIGNCNEQKTIGTHVHTVGVPDNATEKPWNTLLVGWSVGRLVGWSVGRLVGWSVGRLVGWSRPKRPFLLTTGQTHALWAIH